MAEQKTITQVVGSSIADWVKDPTTGKERTPQQIIAAVTDAILAEPNLARGVSLDPLTGKPRPSTDQQMVDAALTQLAANAKFEGPRYAAAQEVSRAITGGGRGAGVSALVNRPDLWALGKENVGKVIDRKNFDDPTSVQRFVVDPTTNQLTPEQLKQFREIGAAGGMAIDPVTGFQVLIDQQGRYTLGEQPEGDVTGLNYATYSPNQVPFTSDFISLGGGTASNGNIVSQINNADGSKTVTYKNGTTETFPPGINIPGTPTGPTLAVNTFKNTLALYFGASEMTKPWVDGLYKSVSGFYKTGSSMEESFNLALMESKGNPNMTEFTKRFKGIYDLTELRAKGGVVTVPTIAEYFATETTMGQVLTSAGLGSLANEEFLGNIIGKNVSVTEFTNRISKVYDRIDSAPAELKTTFARYFPSLDRTTLAKALLTGEKGAADLAKEVATYEIVSASEQQGLGAIDPVTGKPIGIGLAEAGNIAAQGYGYQAALTGFGQISQNLQPYEKLMEIASGQDVSTDDARKQLQDITFGKLASAQRKADQLAAQEEARFRGSSGLGRGGLTSQKFGVV
jgi:hypothetical protein